MLNYHIRWSNCKCGYWKWRKNSRALLEFTKGKTLIVITHKIKTVISADKIIYMENGKIICDGKHEELIKSCSAYKHLYEIANWLEVRICLKL